MSKKYIYYLGSDPRLPNDVEHFEFPKINFPDLSKIQLPKVELPKINLPNIDIGKEVGKAVDSINPFKKTDRKEYEWKNHKWKARKRDKNGKWIYDYGNGFPGEKNYGSTAIDPRTNENLKNKYSTGDESDNIHGGSKIAKFIEPFVGLGMALLGPSAEERKQGGELFIGSMIEHAKDLKHAFRKFGAKIDKTGFPLKKAKTSKEDDLDSVNPGFHAKDGFSQMNCPCCTVAYDLRRRGYEVVAKEDADGCSYKQVMDFYKNPNVKYVVSDGADTSATDAINKQMSKEPNGSTGYAFVQWGSGGGHIFNYEIENGTPVIYDAQSGKKLPLSDYAELCTEWTYFRTDDLEPNYDVMKEFVE